MYSRSDSVTLTVQRESFAFSRTATRSTEPEVFTFERIPARATAVRSYAPIRPKKRCTRVMYPAKVRMHLPPPEKNRAKRWLVVLCLVVLWQIYTEEPCADAPPGSADSPVSASLQPAEEDLHSGSPVPQLIPSTACPKPGEEAEASRSLKQSSG
ncbi:radiation-inducible immediate-early gene IEX-1 [Brachionichthys hirsutus]|uniref:radiation-inducible immediate-early gene IEX-1 n=1 Tax=Brachionichthys hirsutus TaxID=412623 RepID=UPI003604AB93